MRRITAPGKSIKGVRFVLLVSSALVSLYLAQPGASSLSARPSTRTVRIGIVNTLAPGIPTGILTMAMRPFRTFMEEQTGATGEVVRSGDAFDLARQLEEEKLQVGIFHGHEFAWAKAKYPNLEPIVVCINPIRNVRACLVTSTKTLLQQPTDLEGKTVSLPRDNKAHCRVFFEQRLNTLGRPEKPYFRRIARPSYTEDALDDVVAGKAQAAVVDLVAFERYRKSSPSQGKKLRILLESEPFPPGVVAYSRDRFPASDAKRFREALLSARNNASGRQTLQVLKLASFEPAPENLEDVLKTIAKAYPPPGDK